MSRRGRRIGCPSPTRRGSRASGEFSTPVPQSGRPLLTTVPHRGRLPAARGDPSDPGCRSTSGLRWHSRAGKDVVRTPPGHCTKYYGPTMVIHHTAWPSPRSPTPLASMPRLPSLLVSFALATLAPATLLVGPPARSPRPNPLDPTRFEITVLATGLKQPMEMAVGPDRTVYYIELDGKLRALGPARPKRN